MSNLENEIAEKEIPISAAAEIKKRLSALVAA